MGFGKYPTEIFSVTVLVGWRTHGCHGYLQLNAALYAPGPSTRKAPLPRSSFVDEFNTPNFWRLVTLILNWRLSTTEVKKPKTTLSQRPIRTRVNITRFQWKLKVITCNRPQARENADDQVAISFSFASDWLWGWREISRPITERSKAKPMRSRICFYIQLKIALGSNSCKPISIATFLNKTY